jgi:hypothetical protein
MLAEAYHSVGNLTGALAAINRLLERAPEDGDARFRRGLLARAAARPNLAADNFTRVLAVERDWERARYHGAAARLPRRVHRAAAATQGRPSRASARLPGSGTAWARFAAMIQVLPPNGSPGGFDALAYHKGTEVLGENAS